MSKEKPSGTNTDKPSLAIAGSLQSGRVAAFTLDLAFIDSLTQRLQEERAKANEQMRKIRGLSGRLISYDVYGPDTVPNTSDLQLLIEAAFWASLEREEGRSLKFSIYYGPASDYAPLKFRVAKPYSVATLVKLSSAVANKVFGIAAYKLTDGKLEVWGLEGSAPLTIDVLEPGKLIIKFGTENVAAISGSQTLLIRSPHSSLFSPFWKKFAHRNESSEYFAWRDPRIRTLLAVLRAMQEFHHGGVLVVVPDDDSWRGSISIMSYEAGKPSSALKQVIDRLNDKQQEGELLSGEIDLDQSYLDTLSKGLASLTCVDGAVIIDYGLHILGFGAKFNVAPLEDLSRPRVMIIDPLDHQEHMRWRDWDELEWGMRHQSAARFVLANHDALAFVASQDGVVTAFVWEQWGENNQYSSLVAYSQLELTMF